MIRIYLIVTLCLFTFFACTNSANSNDQEEADNTDKSDNLENAIGSYYVEDANIYEANGLQYHIYAFDIFSLPNSKYGLSVKAKFFNSLALSEPGVTEWRRQSWTFNFAEFDNGRWTVDSTDLFIITPEDGFSEDLSSIVLAYEDSTGQVQAYPFYKVK